MHGTGTIGLGNTATSPMSQSKRWVFTLNNPGTVIPNFTNVRYGIYGRETGESGTPHLQGFVVFRTNQRLGALRDWLPGAHFEKARGTSREASEYCKKDGDYAEEGICPEDCKRQCTERWKEAIASARAGTIEETHPDIYVRYNGFCLREAARFRQHTALDDVCGLWIQGPSGAGKSYWVRQFGPLFDKQISNWWCGYMHEPIVLIDDVTPDNAKFIASNLLRWCDRYPCNVQVKGGAMQVRPKLVCVTSNYNIDQCFGDCGVSMDAMKRRFHYVYKSCIEEIHLD
jgi:hypothetical protein